MRDGTAAASPRRSRARTVAARSSGFHFFGQRLTEGGHRAAVADLPEGLGRSRLGRGSPAGQQLDQRRNGAGILQFTQSTAHRHLRCLRGAGESPLQGVRRFLHPPLTQSLRRDVLDAAVRVGQSLQKCWDGFSGVHRQQSFGDAAAEGNVGRLQGQCQGWDRPRVPQRTQGTERRIPHAVVRIGHQGDQRRDGSSVPQLAQSEGGAGADAGVGVAQDCRKERNCVEVPHFTQSLGSLGAHGGVVVRQGCCQEFDRPVVGQLAHSPYGRAT